MPGQLAAEIKQTKPFTTLEEEAVVSLARTAALQDHAGQELMAGFGITQTQYNVLRILRGAGTAGLGRNQIGERMINRVPDVTRLLDRMEAVGLVERERGDDDRRCVTARITREGLKVLTRIDQPLHEFLKARVSHLGPEKLRTLIDLLADLRTGYSVD
ncbi:MAG TPA: MarR family transcriptional regulator [Gemmatimonadales bacterium]|jgi:DNA-binding MarR family transcriptional regulator|nr:MarR family transcriptional regulator [Gemmatimonadales bacterium]